MSPAKFFANVDVRWGKKLKMPVYEFLKEALIRKFGADFYEALHQVALDHFEAGKMKR